MENNSTYLLPIIGEIGKDFKYSDFLMHMNAAKNATIIHGVVGSVGGDIEEGLKIRNGLLNSGKLITMSNSGDVASIAVSIFLAASKENRKFDPSKGVFLIHLPLVQPEDLTEQAYTAEDLDFISKSLKNYGNDLAKQYNKDTGADLEILKAFMAENKPLTAEQVSSLGFATIEQPAFKAVALITTKNNKMENEKVIEELTKHGTLLDKIHKFLFAKNIMLQDVKGVEIDFGDAIQTPDQVAVGVEGKVDGKPAEGDYTMADGTILTFAKGVLNAITPPAQANIEAVKAENVKLSGEIKTLTEARDKLQKEFDDFKALAVTQLDEAKKEFTAFKNKFSKENPYVNKTPETKEKELADKDAHRKQFGL